MDDLISRKALDDAFTELRWKEDGTLNHFGDRPDWCMHGSEVDKLIQSVPSVPAVPMDKLCEYLNSVIYPCIICKESPGPQCNAKREGCWERVLEKWMEGLDDHR